MGVTLANRRGFGKVPFPEFFGIDPMIFMEGLDQEALENVQPQVVDGYLHDATAGNVMFRRREPSYGSVVLSSAEIDVIPRSPELVVKSALAGNSARSLRGVILGQDERILEARDKASTALDEKVERMHGLIAGYDALIFDFTMLHKAIPYHWHANQNELSLRVAAHNARESFHNVLQVLADSRGWSESDLRLARLALDYGLVGPESGKSGLDAKKSYWANMVRTVGNYTKEINALVGDRVVRSVVAMERVRRGEKI